MQRLANDLKRIYFISGLGADKRVFEKLIFPENFELIYLDWVPPISNESLSDYAIRLSSKIDTSEVFYLIGVSFGGMLAVEIAKKFRPVHTFVISSIITRTTLPWYYKLAGTFNLHRLMPTSLMKQANPLVYKLFGSKTHEERNLLKNILTDTDPIFLKWALQCILKWDNVLKPDTITHIHGTSDKILPIKYVMPDATINNGGHLMVYTHAFEISAIITKTLQ